MSGEHSGWHAYVLTIDGELEDAGLCRFREGDKGGLAQESSYLVNRHCGLNCDVPHGTKVGKRGRFVVRWLPLARIMETRGEDVTAVLIRRWLDGDLGRSARHWVETSWTRDAVWENEARIWRVDFQVEGERVLFGGLQEVTDK